MNELLVLGLVSTMISGTVGSDGVAQVVAYSPLDTTIEIQNQTIQLHAGKTQTIEVKIPIKKGTNQINLEIQSTTTTYQLPITVVGHYNLKWLWWIAVVPLIGAILAIRIKRINVGNS